jgi:acyl-CoA thioesterase-1
MRKVIPFLASCLILSSFSSAQKKTIAVIGSSTAAGMGASPIDSSWVNLAKKYYQGLGQIDTIYNLAVSGTTTYTGMPTAFVHPNGRPASDPASNVTKALSFNPDLVFVNYPSNDIADGYTVAEFMFNLRTIYNTVIKAQKICYITTTQPRNSITADQQRQQKEVRDSVLAEFPLTSLNFYDPIVASDSLSINPKYNFDGTHVNDAGHRLLFQAVKNTVLLSAAPLALSLIDFTADPEQNSVLLHWTIVNEPGSGSYYSEVERSADGSSFTGLALESSKGAGLAGSYSWTDLDPLPGVGFYRLKMVEEGKESFSRTLRIAVGKRALTIGKVYTAGGNSDLLAEISMQKQGLILAAIFSTSGMPVRRQSYASSLPSTTISLPIATLAAGQYFLRITAAGGETATISFHKF